MKVTVKSDPRGDIGQIKILHDSPDVKIVYLNMNKKQAEVWCQSGFHLNVADATIEFSDINKDLGWVISPGCGNKYDIFITVFRRDLIPQGVSVYDDENRLEDA